MKITYPVIDGCTFVRIDDAETIEEVQEAINRYHGIAKIQGPEKKPDGKYVALGMMEK